MDTVKIGSFIMQLRKEKGLTQAQLGEKIGVTNKTVSRWENGNYLPSVDMLKILSEEFGVSINEILNGERVSNSEYKKIAEENITKVLESIASTLEERINYWSKRWYRNNILVIIFYAVIYVILLTYAKINSNIYVAIFACVYTFVIYIVLHNRKMMYVEKNSY